MPLLTVNAPDDAGAPLLLPPAVTRAAGTASRAVIMVHGFKYSPALPAHCPHAKIYAPDTWPAGLGLTGSDTLCIGFGWPARGRLRRIHNDALCRGAQLASLITTLSRVGNQVHIVAHSLGATLALAALPYLAAGSVGRMLLLSGAAHRNMAEHALRCPAGRQATFIQITSGENAIFDRMFELAVPGSGAIGRGINAPGAHRVVIDCARTRVGLARLGYPIAAPERAICHWSSYRRSGVMALNKALLSGALSPCALPTPAPVAPRRLAMLLQTRMMGQQSPRKATSHEPAH